MIDSEWFQAHAEYLVSGEWRAKRKLVLERESVEFLARALRGDFPHLGAWTWSCR